MDEIAVQADSEVDVAAVLAGLDGPWNVLPEETLRTIQRHRDVFIPHLIDAIRDANSKAVAGEGDAGSRHFYALPLLIEFRCREALPAIMELLALPLDLQDELYGDSMMELMPNALAVMADQQPELIDAFMRDFSIDPHVRWVAIDSILYLVRDGVISRAAAEQRLVDALQHAIREQDDVIIEVLIMALGIIGAVGSRELARDAFEKHDSHNITTWEHVEKDFAAAERGDFSALERLRPTDIGDTVARLKSWGYFDGDEEDEDQVQAWNDTLRPFREFEQIANDPTIDWPEDRPVVARQAAIYLAQAARLDEEEGRSRVDEDRLEPIHVDTKRVGRNDPCPCGSGKKYKKCCGGRQGNSSQIASID